MTSLNVPPRSTPPESERPPTFRHGVSLVYDDGNISIAERAGCYAIVHVANARWFLTDEAGAQTVRRVARYLTQEQTHLPCHSAETLFLSRVLESGFMESARDAPTDIPTVLCLSITERCNLECSYCFYAASYKDNKTALHVKKAPEAAVKSLLVQLHSINRSARVYLTGGEPFLNPDVLNYFALIKEAGLYTGVVTNGLMLSEQRLVKMEELGVDEIRLSVDGATKATHEATRPKTFEKVMASLTRLQGRAFRVVLSMTVTRDNQHEAKELASFARNSGFVVSYSHMVPTGRGAQHRDLLPDYEQLVSDMLAIESAEGFRFLDHENAQGVRRHTCGLAGQSLYVDLNGEAAPCNMLSKTGHALGNVFNATLREVLQGDTAKEVRAGVDRVRYCQNCHVRYICGGPCRASSYFSMGTMQSRGPDCAFKYSEVIDSIFSKGLLIPGPSSVQIVHSAG